MHVLHPPVVAHFHAAINHRHVVFESNKLKKPCFSIGSTAQSRHSVHCVAWIFSCSGQVGGAADFGEVNPRRWVGSCVGWRAGASSRSLRALAFPCSGYRRRRERAHRADTTAEETRAVFLLPLKYFVFYIFIFLCWSNSPEGTVVHGPSSAVVLCASPRVDFCESLLLKGKVLRTRSPTLRIHCRFLLSTHPSLLRWDEFGPSRRGSESTAAPRRGPRVSFTQNVKQQPGNVRELKQRVFRHRAGRSECLQATPFFSTFYF